MRHIVFKGVLSTDLRRAFGPQFCLCVILIAAIHIRAVWLSFNAGWDCSVISLYNEAVTVENYMQTLIPILVSTVFSTAFLDDLHSEFYRFQLMRCTRVQYCGAKLSACALSAFLSMWLGIALFLLTMKSRFPLLISEDIARSYESAYILNGGLLLQKGCPLAYLMMAVSLRSIAMIFWPLCAIAVSAYIPNRFVVLGMPWLLDYAIGMVEFLFHVPYGIRFIEFTTGSAAIAEPSTALIQLLIRYLPLMAICVAIYCIGAKRRLNNG